MSDWPVLGGQAYDSIGESLPNTSGVNVSASASTNTKGSWVQIVASTTRSSAWVVVNLFPSGDADFLVDVGIGASGAERAILPNLIIGRPRGDDRMIGYYFFPLRIPSGTRVAVRNQSTTGSASVIVVLQLGYGGFPQVTFSSGVDAMGDATADSGGTSVDPGAVTDTKGAWSELVASSAHRYQLLTFGLSDQLNTARATDRWLLDIGIGAGGSEKIIIPNLLLRAGLGTDQITPKTMGPFLVDIPAATRVAARAQADGVDATDRLFDLVAYGVF